jgi:DNA-binding HxlR family transcriptional regulator
VTVHKQRIISPVPEGRASEQAAAAPPVAQATGEPDAGRGEQESLGSSALAEALAAVGDRWTLLIVAALLAGARRFGELRRELGGIAPSVLSSRLRQLTEQGLVVAEPYSRRPQRFVYELTESGRELAGPVRLLTQWGARQTGGGTALHAACGNPLEAVWYCPTCQAPVADDEAGDLDYA